jgi:hypothetical protein
MSKTFTDMPAAERWLRWRGFTVYLGFWTWQTEDMTATATVCGVDTPTVTVVVHDEEI